MRPLGVVHTSDDDGVCVFARYVWGCCDCRVVNLPPNQEVRTDVSYVFNVGNLLLPGPPPAVAPPVRDEGRNFDIWNPGRRPRMNRGIGL